MYLEIDEGFFDDPKTLDLCARLEDRSACVYPLRLWKWACRSARDGNLGKIASFAVEKVVEFTPMDGRCFDALCRSGFIDRGEDGVCQIHAWMERTGAAIKRMEEKAKENRARREAAKKRNRAGIVPESGQYDSPIVLTQTSPDQSRPVQSPDLSHVSASDPDPERARSKPDANDWHAAFTAAWWKARGRQYGQGEADAKATARLGDLLASLPESERCQDWEARERMLVEFLARGDPATSSSGWSFAFFVANFNALRIPPEKRPAPKGKPGAPKPVTWGRL